MGVLAIPDQDVGLSSKVAVDEGVGISFLVASLAYFLLIRRRITPHSETTQRIADYHHKVRELVWVRWVQESFGFPFEATSDVRIRPVFEALTGANERYYRSALQHLESYGYVKERETILFRIRNHNQKVDELEASAKGSLITRSSDAFSAEWQSFVPEQNEIWAEVQSFRDKIQGVVNDLEDGNLTPFRPLGGRPECSKTPKMEQSRNLLGT